MYFHVYPVQRMVLWVETNFLSPFDDTRTMSLWNIIGIPWAGVIIFFFHKNIPWKSFSFIIRQVTWLDALVPRVSNFRNHTSIFDSIEYRFHSSAVITVVYDLDPVSILQSINFPTPGELHAGNSKNFPARIVTYKKGIRLSKCRWISVISADIRDIK